MELASRVLAGDRRALARLISLIEDEAPSVQDALSALHPHTGRAHIVGITGAPGTGKSTLVNELAKGFRARGNRRHHCGGPDQPLHGRGAAGRPGPHTGSGRRPRCVHPEYGDTGEPGWAGPRNRRRRPGPGRSGLFHHPGGDGRGWTGGGGHCPHRAHHRCRGGAGPGR